MVRLYDALNEDSKGTLKKWAVKLGMLNYTPEIAKRDVETDCMESVEEVAILMSKKPASKGELREDDTLL